MSNPTAAQPNHDRAFLVMIAIMVILLIGFATCEAQVQNRIYSSWASAQVKHAVETDTPVFKRDTVQGEFGGKKIEESVVYKGFVIYILGGEKIAIRVVAGTNLIILKPEDEYEIIEKLLNLK